MHQSGEEAIYFALTSKSFRESVRQSGHSPVRCQAVGAVAQPLDG